MLTAPPTPPPDRPGCYIFRDGRKKPLYVGKARSLKHRVPNYFQSAVPFKIGRMLALAEELEYVVTASEWEAFVLENNLIKQFKPRFNTLLKDDKTYPFLKVTVKDRYPRAVFTRRIQRDGALYYGPFVPGWQAKKTLKVLQQYFKLVTCKDPLDGSRLRPCLYYEMGQCLAPCIRDRVPPSKYRTVVDQARLFLDGKTAALKEELEARMKGAASSLDFESAAHFRDLRAALDSLGGTQSVARPGEGHWDFFALYGAGEAFVLHGFVVVEGRVVDRRRHRFADVELPPEEFFAAALSRFYASSPVIPDGVAVSTPFEGMGLLARLLRERKGRRVDVVHPRRGVKASLIRTLLENARIDFEQEVDPSAVLGPLARSLGLPSQPARIECFDISHIHGEETVASCVVWERGCLRPSEYRSFRIRGAGAGDDYASMAEVVRRRYARQVEEASALPDLVVVDGGPGQVTAAECALAEVLNPPPPLVGLAKREEWVYLPGRKDPVVFPRESPALRLLQRIRDEAHRRAVTHHRRRRSSARRLSPLLGVPGIGPVTARKLLRAFLTTESVLQASRAELDKVVGKAAAAKILAWAEGREKSKKA